MRPPKFLSARALWLRLSLLAALFALPGCLVDDPPAYTAPQRTAPRIIGTHADPPLNKVIVINENETLNFDVPVMSEDAGELVSAILLLDYDGGPFDPIWPANLPPATLDDGERSLHFIWTVGRAEPAGCHRVTLRVSHASNFASGYEVIDKADLDEVYWFANVNVTAQNANVLVRCPGGDSFDVTQ
jgi:hypothetical protein